MPIAYPYKFSDWYGYDQDCVSTTSYSSSTVSVLIGVCPFDGSNPPANQTYYHSGTGSRPAANDYVYTNSSGTTPLSAGYYRFQPIVGQYFRIMGTSGQVSDIGSCSEMP